MALLSTNPEALYTAQQIAITLARSKRAVQLALASVRAFAQVPTAESRGQIADAWRMEDLPSRLLSDLRSVAGKRGYRDIETLLVTPPQRWQPPIPISKVSAGDRERAAKLQRALRRSLILQEDATMSDAERKQIGLADFRREYGHVSERHWRRLLHRTLERDAGEQRWEDLAIYLAENVSLVEKPKTIVRTNGERFVLDYLSSVKDPANPSAEEAELVWTAVCEELAASASAGTAAKAARRAMVALIQQSGVTMAKNESPLKKTLKRKFAAWSEGGMTLVALKDRRSEQSGWFRAPKLSESERLALVAHARLNCGGRVSQAYRELREKGHLGDELSTHYIDNPTSKSYVPEHIRKAVAGDVNRMEAIHHGPREHKLRGAYHTRDWNPIAAGDWMQADDVTPPVYYWRKDERGAVELLRGQFLPMIDERTTYILGFVLISAANYNSLAIRSLITNVCSEHGLPRLGFSFERGIWKSSRILTGNRNAVPWEVADAGLRSLGLTFRHALLPRGKVIERSIGQLQDMMEGWPGYAGRDERRDCFERMQRQKLDVEAGRVPANAHFMSEEEITAEYLALCERYNHTPQQGRKLDGLTPKEGWERLQSDPRAKLDGRCLHLLAHDRRKVKVGRNGITIQIGKQRFNYKDAETGGRVGETVLAWFNPQRPDLLPCTDLEQRNVFTVCRSFEMPAVGATRDDFEREEGLVSAHNGYAKDLYRVLKNSLTVSHYRANAVDVKTQRVGAEIQTQRKEIQEAKRESAERSALVTRQARAVGVPASIISTGEDAARGLAMIVEALKAKGGSELSNHDLHQ